MCASSSLLIFGKPVNRPVLPRNDAAGIIANVMALYAPPSAFTNVKDEIVTLKCSQQSRVETISAPYPEFYADGLGAMHFNTVQPGFI